MRANVKLPQRHILAPRALKLGMVQVEDQHTSCSLKLIGARADSCNRPDF